MNLKTTPGLQGTAEAESQGAGVTAVNPRWNNVHGRLKKRFHGL